MKGKAWTTEEKDKIIQSLQEYLEKGLSRNIACESIGLAPSTLSNWISQEPSLGMKIQGWENKVNVTATINIADKITEGDLETSKWWAERKMKKDFSTRQELTGAEGERLIDPQAKAEKDKLINELFEDEE